MSKKLIVEHQDRCVGCELCVLECQHQLKTVGLDGSFIRILRNLRDGTKFVVSVDPGVSDLNTKRIVKSCPRGVFAEAGEDGA